jgi:hypothetical protein
MESRDVRPGELHLGGARADDGGDRLARAVEQHPGASSLGVQPAGVRPALVDGLEERGASLREQRRAAAGVQEHATACGVAHSGRRGVGGRVAVHPRTLTPVARTSVPIVPRDQGDHRV